MLRRFAHAFGNVFFAGALLALAASATPAASATFGFSAADSAQQTFNPYDDDVTLTFLLHGGSGSTALTQGTPKTIHVGAGTLSGETNYFDDSASLRDKPLPHTFSLTGAAGTVTQTLPQTDDLYENGAPPDYQTVIVHAGPTVTFDMGLQGRIDVTPQEYAYDTRTGPTPPQFAYTLLLRAPAVPPSGLSVAPSAVTYPASATGTVTLSAPAPDAEVVALTSSAPALALVPSSVIVPAGQRTATFPINTYRVDQDTPVTLSAVAGGTTKSATLTVKTRPEIAFAYSLAALPAVRGQDPDTYASAYLSATGGSGTVQLALDQPYTVPIGSYSAGYQEDSEGYVGFYGPASRLLTLGGQAQPISQNVGLYYSAGDGLYDTGYFDAFISDGVTAYDLAAGRVEVSAAGFENDTADSGPALFTFTLRALNPASALLISPGKVYGGATSYGRITLSKAAGDGGQIVTLQSSDASLATVPASIIVPAGLKTATFPITTLTADEDAPVTLTATAGRKSVTASMTVLARYAFSGVVKSSTAGLSGVVVRASSTGTFTLTSTATPAAAIPDNSTVGLSSTLVPKGTGTISGLVVGLDITHPKIGDLRVTLQGPDGTSAVLYSQSGGAQANIQTSYPVLRTPVDSLSVFSGKAVQGTWTLLVQDLAGYNVGTLNAWNLTFTYSGTYTGSGKTASDGSYTVSNLKEGAYTATPFKSRYAFTPPSRAVTVGPSVVDPDPDGIDFARK